MTNPVAVAAPTTSTIVAALAASLLPFVGGPIGITASALVPAAKQLYDTLSGAGDATFTVEDLVRIIMQDNTVTLAKLTADVNAMP